jgi:hypothetical protein
MRRLIFLFCAILPLTLLALPAPATDAATDYEWELRAPDRPLFRDRTPVGQIALMSPDKKGKPKASGEMLTLLSEVAFVPGDTARFFAASVELWKGTGIVQSAILDAAELPALWRSLSYIITTAQGTSGTERSGTHVSFRSKSGLTFDFEQAGKVQQFSVTIPASDRQENTLRFLTPDQFGAFKDLLDLVLFDLKRQGAAIGAVSEIK